jgi:hypothetical protein
MTIFGHAVSGGGLDVCLTNNFGEVMTLTFDGEVVGGNAVLRGLRDGEDTTWLVYNLNTNEAHLTYFQNGGLFAVQDKFSWDVGSSTGSGAWASPTGSGEVSYAETPCPPEVAPTTNGYPGRSFDEATAPPTFTPDAVVCAASSAGDTFVLEYTGTMAGGERIAFGTVTTAGVCTGTWDAFAVYDPVDGTLGVTAYTPPASCPSAVTFAGNFSLGSGGSAVYVSDVGNGGPVSLAQVACP